MAKYEQKEWPTIGMTVDEVAKVLRVGKREIQDMLARGEFDDCARIVGRTWRISHEGLAEWLKRGGGRKGKATETEDKDENEPEYAGYMGSISHVEKGR